MSDKLEELASQAAEGREGGRVKWVYLVLFFLVVWLAHSAFIWSMFSLLELAIHGH